MAAVFADSGPRAAYPPPRVFDPRLVTDDTDLTELNPWNGGLILRLRDSVDHVVQSRRER